MPDPAVVLLCDDEEEEPEVDDDDDVPDEAPPYGLEVDCCSWLVELDPEPLAVPPLACCFALRSASSLLRSASSFFR